MDFDFLPVRLDFPVFILQEHPTIVRIAIGNNLQDPTVVVQQTDAFLNQATNVEHRSDAGKDSIKESLANNEVKGSVLKGQRPFGDVEAQKFHAWLLVGTRVAKKSTVVLVVVTFLHLANHNWTKVHLHEARIFTTSLSCFKEVGSKGRVAASQHQNASIVGMQALKGLGISRVRHIGCTG